MDPTFRATDLIVEASPISPAFSGTVQELLDAFVERLRIVSPFRLLRVVVSDTQPTSNQGLWLKDGTKPYVWDESSSTYVPIDIDDSLGYSFDKIVEIVLGNFDPATLNLLAGRISASAMLADKIVTATKFIDAFGTPNSVFTTNADGKLTFVTLTPGQSIRANPGTGLLEGFIGGAVAELTPGAEGDALRTRSVSGVLTAVWEKSEYSTAATGLVALPPPGDYAEIPHGLTKAGVAAFPADFDAFLVCQVPQLGYVVGEKVRIYSALDTNDESRQQWSVSADNASIYVLRVLSGENVVWVYNKLTGSAHPVNTGEWRLAGVAST